MHHTRDTERAMTDDADDPRVAHQDDPVRKKDRADEESERADAGELDGLGQAGTSEPQPGIGQYQGGGIEGAIGGGQSGQGGG